MTVLAIDQGTTSTRGILVGPNGECTEVFSAQHRQYYPRPGWVEHDPGELLANVAACIDAARPHGPLTIGLANQGESCLAWDAKTGEAISKVIVWQDDRTAPRVRDMGGHSAFVLERTGLPLDPYFSASKLAWIMQEIPKARDLLASGRLRLGTTDAFFRDRLTGRFETDIATASRTSLMDIAKGEWDTDLCALFGVPLSALPVITPCSGAMGTAAGVPLNASIVDQQAALFGHGCRASGQTKVTFGTGAFVLALTGERLPTADGGPLPTVAWQEFDGPVLYALEGATYCASAAVNWARQIGLLNDFNDLSNLEDASALQRGLAFVPALAGLACPHWNRSARGAWLGLSLDTSRSDMLQALLEGVAYRVAEVVSAIEAGVAVADPLLIDGGMSANPGFCQIVADITGRTVGVSNESERTSLGAAMLAGRVHGLRITPEGAARVFAPRKDYQANHARFARAVACVRDFA
ncbi:FGGY family carbohydrate kinase [Amaricoccus macauensis]|uniref:FGGY family carbohydrate kinase n=1 Tax=Amaricoccus macauensis TaxID=57001 RepID=UPI003C7CD0FE